jgi:hypothetical protein
MPAPASEGEVDSPIHSGVPVSLRLAIPPAFISACMMFPSGPPGVRAVGSMRADALSAILVSLGSRLAQVHTIASAALPSRLDAGFAERCGRSLRIAVALNHNRFETRCAPRMRNQSAPVLESSNARFSEISIGGSCGCQPRFRTVYHPRFGGVRACRASQFGTPCSHGVSRARS